MAGPNPRARATSALFQSNFGRQGNFELVVTNNQFVGGGGRGSGDLRLLWRNNDTPGSPWGWVIYFTTADVAGSGSGSASAPPVELAFRFPCWFQCRNNHFHGSCLPWTQVKYFAR